MRNRRTISPGQFNALSPDDQKSIARLLSVFVGSGKELPAGMLDEISAISVEGVDPQWQIEQMERILDRWAPKHCL